ncbi:MAG: hypothetical protein SGPRY_006464, partial [Prymnesium sp.]
VTFKGLVGLHPPKREWFVVRGCTLALGEEGSSFHGPFDLGGGVCSLYKRPKSGKHHIPMVAELYAKGRTRILPSYPLTRRHTADEASEP